MIYEVPEEYDVIISYSWFKGSHGKVSGHVFEVLDYYFLLCPLFRVGIFLGDGKTAQDLISLAQDKYSKVPDLKDILISDSPRLIKAEKAIFILTDGSASNLYDIGGYIFCKELILFRCGKVDSFGSLSGKDNVHLLQDNRVYDDKPLKNTIHYVKKILFSALKPKTSEGSSTLLYLTTNCRQYSIDSVKSAYDFDNYTICTGDPIPNLINKINSYIYTPVFCRGSTVSPKSNFDCSPRLIAECHFYNIPVYYHEIDYSDTGLETRKSDILNDFDSLHLLPSDPLIQLIRDFI